MRVHDFSHAILRAPGRSVADGLRAHDRPGPRYEALLAEHRDYGKALADAGVAVEILDPLEQFPDSIFVEDPALVFGEGAILLNPGAPTRNAEVRHLKPTLEKHFAKILQLDHGYVDGGDILVTPEVVMIGLSARTDRAGATGLAAALKQLGRTAAIVHPPEGALHLKTIASLIDEETILTTTSGEESGLFGAFRQIVVDRDEEPAANALRINDRLLLSHGFPRIAERLDRAGYSVKLLQTEHVSRVDAGLSCMSLRWAAVTQR